MQFGFTLKPEHTPERTLALTRQAEAAGFDHGWLFDSHVLWRVEQVSHALANGYYVGTINRVGIEPLGDDDFYGQSYFVDPRGQFVGDVGSAHDEELIVRDLDLDRIMEVRNTWQFFRDRRPDAYEDLVRP